MTGTLTRHPSRSTRGRRTTDATRSRRNAAIVASRLQGKTWAEVAVEHGVSSSRAREIVADARDAGEEGDALLNVNPTAVLSRVVQDHEWAIRRLRELAEAPDNTSAAVGAARSVATVGRQLLEVLAVTGLGPRLGTHWPNAEDWRRIVDDLLAAAEADGIDPTAVMESFTGATAAFPGLGRVDATRMTDPTGDIDE